MGKKATKAADNVFCSARYQAAKTNGVFESRESTAEKVGMDRTRLARIELGTLTPYPEEVVELSEAYGTPELCNKFCANECPIGKRMVKEIEIDEFDRLALKVLGSMKNIEELRHKLIDIAEDGMIDQGEYQDFDSVLDELEKISQNAQALQLWAMKNIKALNKDK